MTRRLALILALLLAALGVAAQKPLRPVEAAYTVGIGSGHLTDTYLSPLSYSGLSLALAYERRQAMRFDPERWTMRLAGSITGMKTQNQAGNATLWDASLRLSWGMTRRYALSPRLTLAFGPATTLRLGCLYSQRNSNNPASAKASWTLDLTGYAAYRLNIGRLPVSIVYAPTLPVVGAFFSPAYGELYYEIYLGNRRGLAHCAWWGNYFAMDHLITADLAFGATSLRLGFRADLLSTRVNNLNTRIAALQAVIGVSGSWLSVDPRRRVSDGTRIINATY